MKIKCEFCGRMFDDSEATCPGCGAANPGVVRKKSTQPLTIEELAKWYADRGLPPYETTRFFIGQNHKGPRAFGIYKDEKTGNFVVYKNKDNGQRAVRYEGTDEAYAVNELFQRLKQEIVNQKGNKVAKASGGKVSNPAYSRPAPKKDLVDRVGCVGAALLIIGVIIGGLFGLYGILVLAHNVIDEPENGYYQYNGEVKYYMSWYDYDNPGYVTYDPETDSWSKIKNKKEGPQELKKWKTAQNYYLGEKWKKKYGCSDFLKTEDYVRYSANNDVNTGYFKYDDIVYYHDDSNRYTGWYMFDDDDSDWHYIGTEDLPYDLTQYYRAEDFYYTPDWDTETQLTDFTDTDYYSANHAYTYEDDDDDNSSWWDNSYDNDDDYDWDWGSDSWDSGGSDWDSDW